MTGRRKTRITCARCLRPISLSSPRCSTKLNASSRAPDAAAHFPSWRWPHRRTPEKPAGGTALLGCQGRGYCRPMNAVGPGANRVGRDPPDQARLGQLAEEQAALRRMATLVAQGVPPVEIFSAVSDEVGRLFRARAAVLRFEHDGPAVVFVGVSKSLDLPVGTRWAFQPGMVSTEVYRTGCSARVDAMDWVSARGPVAGAARRLGTVSTVGSPLLVEARRWGVMTVASAGELLPFGTEGRLENFTELLATAIANAKSRSELAASRRRIVAAADEARRRIERDLHDGTQQRLVSLALAARA